MQTAPELRVEAVDYVQQDMIGQPVGQTAETLAILVDTTAGAAELQAAKTIIKQVLFMPYAVAPAYIPSSLSVTWQQPWSRPNSISCACASPG